MSDSIYDRPLWRVALMFAFHFAYMGGSFVVITTRYADAITERFGSPAYVFAAVIFAIALLPLVASFFPLGRELWDTVGRDTPRRAALKIAIVGVVLTAIVEGALRYAHANA